MGTFEDMDLDPSHLAMLRAELHLWHSWYLPPERKTVLTVGLGNGETARMWFNHGTGKIIGIEGDRDAAAKAARNFPGKKVQLVDMDDVDLLIVRGMIDFIELDCEGGEKNMCAEIHYPWKIETLARMPIPFRGANLRFVEDPLGHPPTRIRIPEYWGGPFRKVMRVLVVRVFGPLYKRFY